MACLTKNTCHARGVWGVSALMTSGFTATPEFFSVIDSNCCAVDCQWDVMAPKNPHPLTLPLPYVRPSTNLVGCLHLHKGDWGGKRAWLCMATISDAPLSSGKMGKYFDPTQRLHATLNSSHTSVHFHLHRFWYDQILAHELANRAL